MSTTYITGHKNPDLDSVVGAIAYTHLKKEVDPNQNYKSAIVGNPNLETKYVLDRFNLETPELLTSVEGKSLILVDHNEREQAVDGIEEAKILEIIDHHKMNFSYSEPIRIIIEPLGSSCTVIAKMFKADEVEIPKDLAGAMLGAVLTDTVITKSPTTTDEDLDIIEELALKSEIRDWKEYGMEIFKVRSSVTSLTNQEIITSDYKDFDIGGLKFGVGQVETVDPSEFSNRKDDILKELQEKREAEGYHTVILFISDILSENSEFLVASNEPEKISSAFGKKMENDSFTAGVLSRKKQVIPALMEQFSSGSD